MGGGGRVAEMERRAGQRQLKELGRHFRPRELENEAKARNKSFFGKLFSSAEFYFCASSNALDWNSITRTNDFP
jgi:hypothetical protein